MTPTNLRDEIRRFDATRPLVQAWTPPGTWYVEPEIYKVERLTVFRNNWIIAARIDQVDAPRKFVCGEIAGERYVIVRGDDGVLRAFHNVCRHHAAAVMEGEGSAKRLVCPYHGWTYGLDGRLINAPETDGVEDFDPSRFGLVPMAVEAWGPLVFISMGEKPRPLADDLKQLKTDLDAMNVDSLRFVRRRTYTLACNWKVYVDNYLDGGYHVVYLHKGLAGQLDLNSYKTETFDRFSIQSSAASGKKRSDEAGAGKDFSARIGGGALYAWIYPNLMINRYGDIMDTNWVLPLGHDRTQVVFDYYFLDPKNTDFIERSIAASDVVQQEDTGICEAVQVGLMSRSYDRGRYAPREIGEYHFHGLLARDLVRED
jgi:choline monooxygenase